MSAPPLPACHRRFSAAQPLADRVRLAHGDDRPRHLKPGGELRYRLDLFEAKTLTVREGERLRRTRNDRERGLANGERTDMLETVGKALRLRLADGREAVFARNDPQLRNLAYAYASTVHAALGQTHDRVIAMLDTGAGPLVNRQTLCVQLGRARGQALALHARLKRRLRRAPAIMKRYRDIAAGR